MNNINNIKVILLKLVIGLLFLTVLFSVLIWFVSGAFLPFIVSGVLFTTFTVVTKIKYGLKIVEPTNDVYMKNRNDYIDECHSKHMDILTNPAYSHIPTNIHYDRD